MLRQQKEQGLIMTEDGGIVHGDSINIEDLLGEGFEWHKKIVIESGQIVITDPYDYAIDLNRCDTHEKILAWACHLADKNWATPQLLAAFMQKAASANGLEITRSV